jgi:DNA topoisomerase-1
MRTDSTTVSPEAQTAARKIIEETLGAKYLPDKPPQYKTRVANAQEAHEAIRPTDVRRFPRTLKPHLSERQFQLYDLIWRRFVASQMAPAVYDVTTVDVVARSPSQVVKSPSDLATANTAAAPSTDRATTRLFDYLFRATGRVLLFDGFLRVWEEEEKPADDEDEPQTLPDLKVDELLDLLALIPRQHFTQPPPRYTESALVKALEERGIGRPSTYAGIVSTIKARDYVALDKRALFPTPLGEVTCDALVAAFPDVMDYAFTARTEEWLDDVSRGERKWVAALQAFYDPFAQALRDAPGKMSAFRAPPEESTPAGSKPRSRKGRRTTSTAKAAAPGVVCPRCGSPMIERSGKNGRFYGCSRFPACKGTRNMPAD